LRILFDLLLELLFLLVLEHHVAWNIHRVRRVLIGSELRLILLCAHAARSCALTLLHEDLCIEVVRRISCRRLVDILLGLLTSREG
jgi:hypothetical protein